MYFCCKDLLSVVIEECKSVKRAYIMTSLKMQPVKIKVLKVDLNHLSITANALGSQRIKDFAGKNNYSFVSHIIRHLDNPFIQIQTLKAKLLFKLYRHALYLAFSKILQPISRSTRPDNDS